MDPDVVVETPVPEQVRMNHERCRIRLGSTLLTATQYPADYGFVPHTCAEDGEPLDPLVLVTSNTSRTAKSRDPWWAFSGYATRTGHTRSCCAYPPGTHRRRARPALALGG
ncbi:MULTISPECIES: inorganic diphosphatase [unclassified Saccharopolyspora]|uniref:inorganic diphosphatase n=1 Tax=unclassified Saccharopolyspora TaxID=2646250 RepID=UPI001CD29BA1|nr:inorganic diphosphatase [Saccharopolyspora sp. 6T]MCA1194481.1 inorganic diphosphatase [Saccharopolyspora sp. 6V]MCA1226675.1 inorganic diphosphatase [Saccharopolyspora sp. 6M]MCA1278970.1 inorganic diphosphatase [Saccharopolyspora sp. 7B]